MRAKISKSVAKGVIKAPPSKSYMHRYLISAALAGKSKVSNVSFSNDVLATLSCLKSLGFIYKIDNDSIYFDGYQQKYDVLDCKESGSTLRFFIPLMIVLNQQGKLIGTEKLFSRGLDTYLEIFKKQSISYSLNKNSIEINGDLKAGKFVLKVDKSSQYVTGLLFALPLLKEDSSIYLEGKIESESYINITIDVLKTFGIDISKIDNVIYIKGNQKYKSNNVEVEGDYSNAAFLEALNYLGGKVEITGLNPHSIQGDKIYLECFPLLRDSHPTIDISNCIDLGPILFILASIFNGAKFINVERLRIKESDRIKDIFDILEKFGVSYYIRDNEVEINKSKLNKIEEVINLPNDHRITMSIAILLTLLGGEINNIEAVNKSYPDFFNVLKQLNIEVEIYDE